MKTIDFLCDIKKVGLPFIKVDEGVYNGMCFLVDTGCSESVMYSFVARHFQDELRTEDKEGTVFGLEGKPMPTQIVSGDFLLGGTLTTIQFHVLNDSSSSKKVEEDLGFQLHGILGIDFMLANNWMIDIANQRIIVDDQAA